MTTTPPKPKFSEVFTEYLTLRALDATAAGWEEPRHEARCAELLALMDEMVHGKGDV